MRMIPQLLNAEIRSILYFQTEFRRMRFVIGVAVKLPLCFNSLVDFRLLLFRPLNCLYLNENFSHSQENSGTIYMKIFTRIIKTRFFCMSGLHLHSSKINYDYRSFSLAFSASLMSSIHSIVSLSLLRASLILFWTMMSERRKPSKK